MEYIAIALDFLQGEELVTLGHLLPTIEALTNHLEERLTTSKLTLPLLEAALQGIEKRFQPFYDDEDCVLAATLHPQ